VRPRLLVALAAYVGLLWLVRPLTPFEWDEVLFLRALERYDVGAHSPHPPGYPLYVAAGKLLDLLLGNPLIALQLVSVLSAGAAVALLWVLARRLGLDTAQATAAAAVLALTPAFVFNANVGLSDVPSVAAALAAALPLFDSIADRRRLPAAAAATAAALAIRPQLVVALLPLGAAALAAAIRGRHWRQLAVATAVGVAVSAAIWGPAIALTGADRFFAKLDETARWMAINEADGRIGGAALEPLLRHWTVYPFVRFGLAAPLWALLVWGGRRLWRAGNRTAVAVAATSAGAYLVTALFTLHMSTSVRYILPAMPFLALFAAGLPTPGGRRPLRIAAVGGWLVASIVVAGPAYEIRARRPAPAWEALEWIANRPPEERRVLVAMDEFLPHARYVLAGSGTTIVDPEPGVGYAPDLIKDGGVLLLTRFPVPESETLLQRWWKVDAVTRLGRRRYQRASVSRLPQSGAPQFSTDWGRRGSDVELRVAGSIALPAGEPPWSLELSPDRDVLISVGDAEPRRIAAGASLETVILPGPSGVMRVDVPPGRATLFSGFSAHRLGAESSLIVGPVAHANGVGGALWRSDLVLRNAALEAAMVAVELYRAGGPNPAPEVRLLTVPASGELRVDDVVRGLFASDGAACLRLLADRAGLAAVAQTYDARRPSESGVATVGVQAPPPTPAGATLLLPGLAADSVQHSNVGLLNLESRRVSVEAALVSAAGRTLLRTILELGPGELRQFTDVLRADDGAAVRARAELTPVGKQAQIVAWATVVDTSSGRSRLVSPRSR